MGGKTLKIITGVLFILYFTIFTSVLLIANFRNYDFNGLFPILGKGFKTTFFTGLSNMFAFSSISILYFLPPFLEDNKAFKRVARISTIFSVILFFLGIVIYV